ncbi:MAG: hypothetical protein ACXVB0_14140 [Mucilaginibacter sp.]
MKILKIIGFYLLFLVYYAINVLYLGSVFSPLSYVVVMDVKSVICVSLVMISPFLLILLVFNKLFKARERTVHAKILTGLTISLLILELYLIRFNDPLGFNWADAPLFVFNAILLGVTWWFEFRPKVADVS